MVETIGTVEENAYSLVCEFIKEKSLLKTTMNSIRFRSLLTELDWQKQNQTALTRLQSHQKPARTKVILKRNRTGNPTIERGEETGTKLREISILADSKMPSPEQIRGEDI